VVFVVVAQQDLGDGQADQLGVGDRGRASRPGAVLRAQRGMMRSVNSTYSAIRRVSRSAITDGPMVEGV
jgi:hypothetical protein